MGKKSTDILIANPLYDTAFKKLMTTENDVGRENARYFIGTILGEEITEIEYLPQESAVHNKKKRKTKISKEEKKLTLMRLDFAATIRTAGGEKKRLLIETGRSIGLPTLFGFGDISVSNTNKVIIWFLCA
jgi:hypothetical protein